MNYILSTIFFVSLIFAPFSANAESYPHKRVIVVLVNDLSLEDLQQISQQTNGEWAKNGYIGGMNLRTAGSTNDINNLVTMGSGNRAIAVDKSTEAYSGKETVGDVRVVDLYKQLTGKTGEEQSIYIPAFQLVVNANAGLPYSGKAGLLGDILHAHGLKTAVVGNSDKGKKGIVRFAPLLLADSSGVVDQGNVGADTLRLDVDHVYGTQTNYSFLLHFLQSDQTASLIGVELGDLYRLYTMKRTMDQGHFLQMKQQVLGEISLFVGRVLNTVRPGDLVCLVSPMVNEDAVANKSLMAPIMFLTPTAQKGILTSSTTRQNGVVGNLDFAPTVLKWLDLPIPASIVGKPIKEVQNGESTFWSDWDRMKHVYSTRGEVLYGYVSFQIAMLIIATAIWAYARPGNPLFQMANRLIRFFLLVLSLSPVLFLILPLFRVVQEVDVIILLLLFLGTMLSIVLMRLPFAWIFLLVSVMNWVPILVDGMILQSFLMKQSYLGYDPIIGARFYGIGNEYMGVVIGSSILTLAMLLEVVQKEMRMIKGLSVLVFGSYLIFFSLPEWGTNAGGALTAIAAYITSFYRLFDFQLNRKYLFWGGVAILVSIFTLFAVNLSVSEDMQSHIGRAMQKLLEGDFHEIWNISRRKLEMNWHLIQVSSWSKVFITSLLILGVLCYRPTGMIAKLSEKYPYAVRGFFGIIVGAFTALVVNDSGIVAAATTIIYMVVPLLYISLKEKMG